MNRSVRTIPFMTLIGFLAGCAGTRALDIRVESAEGDPMAGAFVMAAPIGISTSPLPVSLENLREVESASGTGGATDRNGRLRLTIEGGYDYELRVQPSPMSEAAKRGMSWIWIYRVKSGRSGGATLDPVESVSEGTTERPIVTLR